MDEITFVKFNVFVRLPSVVSQSLDSLDPATEDMPVVTDSRH